MVKHDDSDARSELTPGSFAYMPAKMVHEAWAKDDGATYFITADGAFDINWAGGRRKLHTDGRADPRIQPEREFNMANRSALATSSFGSIFALGMAAYAQQSPTLSDADYAASSCRWSRSCCERRVCGSPGE